MANYNAVSDWSTTAASNTTVSSTDIGENCAIANLNNMGRAIMAGTKGALTAVTASGGDTYTASFAPAPDALSTASWYVANFASSNTSSTPTINFNSLGAKTITDMSGNALTTGSINGYHALVYDGTNMRVLNPANFVSTNAAQTLTNKTINSATLSTATLSGTISGTYTLGGTPTLGASLAVSSTASNIGSSGAGLGGVFFGTSTTSLQSYSQQNTWTPSDASGAGLTFTGVSAQWTRIGNMIFAYGSVIYPTTADASTSVIGGLPVTVPNASYARQGILSFSSSANAAKVLPNANATTFGVYTSGGASTTNAQLSGVQLFFMLIYPAA